MQVIVELLKQSAIETFERTTQGLEPEDSNKRLLNIGATTSSESRDQQLVSFGGFTQFVTFTSQFTAS